ncbi:cysteine--tRNA ligase, partial [bacterium]|nr:cysteine--tRNA ligase [bacterium]
MSKQIFLTNTLGQKKELFAPIRDGKVYMYVCGITPYDYSHIGHGRSYVNFDILVRLLRFLDYDVTYIRNVTDIDDKLLKKETESGRNFKEIAKFYTDDFRTQMQAVGCLQPTHEPNATDHIDDIIETIQSLIDKGHAYQLGSDVYFDVSSFEPYGKLSGKNLDDLREGARVAVNEQKHNPEDFALWKGNSQDLFWKTPWGHGRPGWHIECSAMIHKFCKDGLDIHAGGADLIFPHHENEIAQSEAAYGIPLAKTWLHNALLNIDNAKMSKSAGKIISLREMFAKHDPMSVRFYFLQHSYRTPINFAYEKIESSDKALRRLFAAIGDNQGNFVAGSEIVKEALSAICDDLNTPKALGILFENIGKIRESDELASGVAWLLENILGIK